MALGIGLTSIVFCTGPGRCAIEIRRVSTVSVDKFARGFTPIGDLPLVDTFAAVEVTLAVFFAEVAVAAVTVEFDFTGAEPVVDDALSLFFAGL